MNQNGKTVYEGNFEKGIVQGFGTSKFDNDQKEYKGDFKQGKPNGYGVLIIDKKSVHKDKVFFIGTFEDTPRLKHGVCLTTEDTEYCVNYKRCTKGDFYEFCKNNQELLKFIDDYNTKATANEQKNTPLEESKNTGSKDIKFNVTNSKSSNKEIQSSANLEKIKELPTGEQNNSRLLDENNEIQRTEQYFQGEQNKKDVKQKDNALG